jgi:YVTN family beta-propeller protein
MKTSLGGPLVVASLTCFAPAPATAGLDRLAFVASEADGQVVVVDLEAERVVKTLATGKTPHAMAVGPGGTIFVNNRGSRELTVIDGLTATVVGAIPLPATSFQLALSPDGKTLAVAYRDALRLSLIDTSTRAVVSTVAVGQPPAGELKGAMMRHPTWSPDGRFVYVADTVNRTIAVVDVAAGRVAATLDLGGVNHSLYPSPDGKLLYAVNERRGAGTSLTLIDPAAAAIVADLPLPLAAGETALGHHGAFTRDGRHFLFCNEGGQQVSVLDVARREWVKAIQTGRGPGHAALSPDGRHFFVVHHHDRVVTVIDAATLEPVKNIRIGDGTEQSHAAWFTPDGKFFYVVAAGDDALVKIDVARLEVSSRIPVGGRSFFFAVRSGATFPVTEY